MKNFIAKIGAVLLALGTVMALSGCGEDSGTNPYADAKMVDSRDGKTYKTVKIGDKVWMAENLNYQTGESKCYDNKPENCDKYGRLYVWSEAVTACPDGWHLPNKQELEDLKITAGQKAGIDMAGTVLKSSTGWKVNSGKSGNGTDGLGFGALPAGSYFSDLDDFHDEGNYALFWSSTEYSSNDAYYLVLDCSYEGAGVYDYDKSSGFSVRCVKNP
ncbi:major paralogous domain-containing protein [Fibrobacter sp. UWH9]|uniref:fibrobacter succinogenes major paralogous domain-containing protein n=1 Tax=Fibrobacter sp. UWH9 TaxID=1896213 RepID=UPI000922E084|nr:fibrobacter succinogenes major paralogous domain-containing protein [Fibrobacter sp. UWH9]SHH69376.1 major paralogous domain-containing protein [Fibrobacter sp. UWH9]